MCEENTIDLPIAGEIKRVDRDVFQQSLSTRWEFCPCCGDVFATDASRLYYPRLMTSFSHGILPSSQSQASVPTTEEMKIDRRYRKDEGAKELRMPIRDFSVKSRKPAYCCNYCQRLAHRHRRKKNNPLRLLKDDFIPWFQAEELVDELKLELKNEAQEQLPDFHCINVHKTLIHKFTKGLWRVCANPKCSNKKRIVYTERRIWFYEHKSTNPNTGNEMSHTTEKWDVPDGDRIIGLLDLDYIPQRANLKWKCCCDACRMAYRRSV